VLQERSTITPLLMTGAFAERLKWYYKKTKKKTKKKLKAKPLLMTGAFAERLKWY